MSYSHYYSGYSFVLNMVGEEYEMTENIGITACITLIGSENIENLDSFDKKVLNKNILGDTKTHDVLYVNISKDGSDNGFRNADVDGQSWENSYNGVSGLNFGIGKLNPDGIIYVYGYDYDSPQAFGFKPNKAMTLIGVDKENCIFNYFITSKNKGNITQKIINLTFHFNKTTPIGDYFPTELSGNNTFINCTFIDAPIVNDAVSNDLKCSLKFYNCEFLNANRLNDNNLSALFKNTGTIEFYDCLFENITYDSIIHSSCDKDGIFIYNSTFKNCNVNGIVDIPGDTDVEDFCTIENCDYDFDATVGVVSVDDYAHNYINATQLKVIPINTVADISLADENNVPVLINKGNSYSFVVSLRSEDDEEKLNAPVDIYINDAFLMTVDDLDEPISIDSNAFALGENTIKVVFNDTTIGDSFYTSSDASIVVAAYYDDTFISIDVDSVIAGNPVVVKTNITNFDETYVLDEESYTVNVYKETFDDEVEDYVYELVATYVLSGSDSITLEDLDVAYYKVESFAIDGVSFSNNGFGCCLL